ncbi:ArsR family transcriptional regulator (plasmid) [Acidithiobacillus caldus SM-1]|uniref:ArsR family transcriptional regulator n=1 Tax=Acidithiobacillus caldus (strain SM-1) TaxID=990288 RepID=F9ZUN1_ACICS|nr:ArsR family transcriptional regulator [Acidithiobacillus caldus SM-1]
MAQVLELSIAGASHQLRALHDRGWLHMRNDGKMVYYRLSPDALRQVLQEGRIFLEEGIAS